MQGRRDEVITQFILLLLLLLPIRPLTCPRDALETELGQARDGGTSTYPALLDQKFPLIKANINLNFFDSDLFWTRAED